MEAIRNLDELVERAKAVGGGKTLIVPAAEAESALTAAALGRRQGICRVILVGDRAGLAARLEKLGEDPADYELVHEPDDVAAAAHAVARVRAGEAHVILKGRLKTGDLMRAVLHRETGLRTGNQLSDVLLTEDPVGEERRLLGLTDGGVNVAPTLDGKLAILKNAVRVFHRLGFARPRVALLCAVEAPTESQPHTLEAAKITELWAAGAIEGLGECEVHGPLALDNALWPHAAQVKGIESPVGGHADILLVPTIEAGNVLGKAFTYFARKPVAHVIEGAKAPVLIPSRVESPQDKLLSIAMGVLAAS